MVYRLLRSLQVVIWKCLSLHRDKRYWRRRQNLSRLSKRLKDKSLSRNLTKKN